ncbi:LuxR C-terminal-related transcriptional regulator [Myxococcota bacterium]|nr:LuxR C-terminal-related transcriptional regulator [Myxococcota bacterium]
MIGRRAAPELRVSRLDADGEALLVITYPLDAVIARAELTPAERAIVEALLAAKATAEIAAERGRSERTIANQIASIYRKLGVGSRAELTAHLAT